MTDRIDGDAIRESLQGQSLQQEPNYWQEQEAAPVPGDDGFRSDDDQRVTPTRPSAREPGPKQAVEAGEAKPSALRSFEHAKLVPQGQEIKLQRQPGASTITEHGQQRNKYGHRREVTRRSTVTAIIPTETRFLVATGAVARESPDEVPRANEPETRANGEAKRRRTR
jgi:hypothetical protein